MRYYLNGSSRSSPICSFLWIYFIYYWANFSRCSLLVLTFYASAFTIISASLSELTEELEKYRLQEIKNRTEDLKPKFKKLNLAEIEKAETFLKQKELLIKINELIGKSGVIGEEVTRWRGYEPTQVLARKCFPCRYE